MPGILLLDTSVNHAEFLARLAARLSSEGHPTSLLGVHPRERYYQHRVARELLPESLDEIDGRPAAAPLDWMGAEREQQVVAEVLRATLQVADAARPIDRAALLRRFRRLAGFFHDLIRARDVRIVLLWNGLALAARALAEAARAAGAVPLFAENGFFPRTMQVDPRGVNAAATIADLPGDFFDSHEPAPGEWDELAAEMRTPPPRSIAPRNFATEGTALGRYADALRWKLRERWERFDHLYPERPFGGWFDVVERASTRRAHARRDDAAPAPALPGRYVFVPLQVRSDTQILEYSPHVKSMPELVERTLAAARAVDPSLGLVVKEHPKDLYAYDEAERDFAARGVTWLRRGDLGALLRGAAAVVTLNSTVGMEALAWGRPVVTLADAFYNKAGIVHHAATPDDLPASLGTALRGEADAERIRRFLCFVRTRWLVRSGARYLDDASIAAAAEALLARGSGSWRLA